MNKMIGLGLALVVLGGALMIWSTFTQKEQHETKILGAKVSWTENEEKRVPRIVSGTILGLGAALVVIGALKSKGRS